MKFQSKMSQFVAVDTYVFRFVRFIILSSTYLSVGIFARFDPIGLGKDSPTAEGLEVGRPT